jgi:O-antigen/teichoic acid export membrane protein
MARHRPLAVISIASGLANLLLSLILVQKVGIIGVALGTLVPTSIECLALVMPYAMNVIGISAREAVSEIWLPTLMPAIPAALLLYLLKAAFQPSSWAVLAAIAAAGLLVYVGGYLSLGATAIERETYTRLALNTIRLARARLKPL